MPTLTNTFILAVNGGSSSLKFALYRADSLQLTISGTISRIGEQDGIFQIKNGKNELLQTDKSHYPDLNAAVLDLIAWLKKNEQYPLAAIGHRLVQGGPEHRAPELITDKLVKSLMQFIYLAPNHLPGELSTIKVFQSAFPDLPQIACFDTAFHKDLPDHVKYYPLPAIYKKDGLMKYGFHGLSYEYILLKLKEKTPSVIRKKVIIAHLGNGASMAAVKDGVSVDTTMGLSPIGGLVMGTRSGDLDPGVLLFLLKQGKLSAEELDDLLSKNSGLKAIAGESDIQALLKKEDSDPTAKEALSVFCYQAKKFIGALAAAMGGLDVLVFTGGIGENSAIIRERICQDLEFLGIKIDQWSNHSRQETISNLTGRVKVTVLVTNEEWMIARHTKKIISDSK